MNERLSPPLSIISYAIITMRDARASMRIIIDFPTLQNVLRK